MPPDLGQDPDLLEAHFVSRDSARAACEVIASEGSGFERPTLMGGHFVHSGQIPTGVAAGERGEQAAGEQQLVELSRLLISEVSSRGRTRHTAPRAS